jgi:hypothetical protein
MVVDPADFEGFQAHLAEHKGPDRRMAGSPEDARAVIRPLIRADQLSGQTRKPFIFPLSPSILDREALILHVAELAERVAEDMPRR